MTEAFVFIQFAQTVTIIAILVSNHFRNRRVDAIEERIGYVEQWQKKGM